VLGGGKGFKRLPGVNQKVRQRVKGQNTLNGVRHGFVPSCLQSRSGTMRALDADSSAGELARKYQLSPKLLERWRGEWRAKGEAAFPGVGRRSDHLPALDDARRIAELERKIGQLTMENDSLKKIRQHFKDHHPPAVVSGADACLKKLSKPRRKAKP